VSGRRLAPLGVADIAQVDDVCAGCMYWESVAVQEFVCGSTCDEEAQREWFRRVHEEWGECGRAATANGEVFGFIKYAPVEYFPQTAHLPVRPPDPDAPLIACLHIRDNARRHGLGRLLLHAALRDMHGRGERRVWAYALANPADVRVSPMVGMDFLLRNGFTVERPHPAYPLMRLDLRSLAVITENLEAVLESLRAPLLRRMPSPTVE